MKLEEYKQLVKVLEEVSSTLNLFELTIGTVEGYDWDLKNNALIFASKLRYCVESYYSVKDNNVVYEEDKESLKTLGNGKII